MGLLRNKMNASHTLVLRTGYIGLVETVFKVLVGKPQQRRPNENLGIGRIIMNVRICS